LLRVGQHLASTLPSSARRSIEISVEPGTAVTKLGSTFTTPQVATTRVRGVLPEYAMLIVAARQRELGGGEERVLAQVDRRGARVRGLADEA
jgi:hypothetical protein